MNKSVFKFRTLVLSTSVVMVIIIVLQCSILRNPEVSFIQPFLRVMILGLVFIGLFFIVSLPWTSSYKFNYKDSNLTDEDKLSALLRLGKLPLALFGTYVFVLLKQTLKEELHMKKARLLLLS